MSSNTFFEIEEMQAVYRRRLGKEEQAHTHTYYTIVFVIEGAGTHLLDFKRYVLVDRQVYFIAPNQTHQIKEQGVPVGWAIKFSEDFLIENQIDSTFISDINLFREFNASPPISLSEQVSGSLDSLANQLSVIASKPKMKFKTQALGALLKLFLIECYNACVLPVDPAFGKTGTRMELLKRFKGLILENYQKEHKVMYYAGQLAITPGHLNKTVKSLLGITAKDYIQSILLVIAKRQLLHTRMNAKEVSYTLGFAEPSHFSHFFKKHTSLSPAEFTKTYNA